jgi:pyruvate formate lyase activating enzyme
MQIKGLIKTTLLDYPGHLACTIFLGGCNFRCPFCHNKNLVLNPESGDVIPYEYIFEYLSKRKNILEGVCISGGEPTLHKELKSFIREIKALGLKVKIDTNGYRPDVIKDLYENHLIDYIAMDIKAPKEKYPMATGVKNILIENIVESIDFIMNNVENYEFRTTVVKELHSLNDIIEIKDWVKGCKLYRIQSYKDSENVIQPGFSSYSEDELKSLKDGPK